MVQTAKKAFNVLVVFDETMAIRGKPFDEFLTQQKENRKEKYALVSNHSNRNVQKQACLFFKVGYLVSAHH